MVQNSNKDKLFTDFAPVSAKEWEEIIHSDLKGADYQKKLVWKTIEGFDVKPYYRREDLSVLDYLSGLPGEFPFVRGNEKEKNDWHIRQNIYVEDIAKSNKKALDILMKGVTSLGFIIDPRLDLTQHEIERLCENIYADAVELNFSCFHDSVKVVQHIEALVKKYNRDPEKIFGSVDFDPLGQLVLNGRFDNSADSSFTLAKQMIVAAKYLPNFKVITITGTTYHNSGSSISEELAFSLAQGAEYLSQLTDSGLSVNDVAPRLKFHFAVGSNYFMEIAKLRAARLLWAHIVKAYGPGSNSKTQMCIHAETGNWSQTIYDPYVNLLRTTTESMSAIIGGVNSLTLTPFDSGFETPTEFSERIARNQQLLLKEESYFDKVIDPAAGSYYVENLTDLLADHAWKLFLEVQEKGGFLEAFRSGFIQQKIKGTSTQREESIATRNEILLGTNQYPGFNESFTGEIKPLNLRQSRKDDDNQEAEPLKPIRGGQAFEEIRYKTDRYSLKNKRPKAFMLTLGNSSIRRTRSLFACNFFACAGFEVTDNFGFKSVKEAADAFIKSKSEIAVVCTSDEEIGEFAPALYDLLNDKAIIVVAGYPKAILEELKRKGINHFIHAKSNVLETLTDFQKILKIE